MAGIWIFWGFDFFERSISNIEKRNLKLFEVCLFKILGYLKFLTTTFNERHLCLLGNYICW